MTNMYAKLSKYMQKGVQKHHPSSLRRAQMWDSTSKLKLTLLTSPAGHKGNVAAHPDKTPQKRRRGKN